MVCRLNASFKEPETTDPVHFPLISFDSQAEDIVNLRAHIKGVSQGNVSLQRRVDALWHGQKACVMQVVAAYV